MVAQPASVPAARRFVDDALTTWGRTDLIEDVGLSVTELATNATLHSQCPFFDVELRSAPRAVRVAVVDGGSLAATSIAARLDLTAVEELTDDAEADPGPSLDLESMTGRGLFIVSVLASRWGIDELPDGTRIWADFLTGDAGDDDGSDGSTPSRPQVSTQGRPAPPATSTQVITLLGCPPDLLLAHDDNLADVARELRLFGATHLDAHAVRVAEQIVEVVRLSALSWDAARLVAREAVHRHLRTVDIAIAVSDPHTLPAKVQVLREAVLTAEQMADAGLLITMPAPDPVQMWRDWVEREMVEQATVARAPRSYADYVDFR